MQVFGADIGQMYETHASISPSSMLTAMGTYFVCSGWSHQAMAYHRRPGNIGPELGEASFDYFASSVGEWTHAVFAWDPGFQVIRDRFVGMSFRINRLKREYRSAGSPLPEHFTVVLPFKIRADLPDLDSSGERRPAETWIAGLGRQARRSCGANRRTIPADHADA